MGGGDPTVEDTPERKALAQISYDKYQYFQNDFMPVRDMWIDEMLDGNNEKQFTSLNNQVSAGNASVFGAQQKEITKGMNGAGLNPNSGAYQGSLADLARTQGEIGSDVLNRAASVKQDNFVKGLGSVVALGEKKSAQAIDGQNTIANMAMDAAHSEAQDKMQKSGFLTDAAATAAGFAYGAHRSGDS
ncbi:hypothetical protein [Pseudoalteromonas galatheae]|uniref:hypothetical protein n=1 Tax=Pseudoalteromonas galatheae TaxID=579562 RepID=UPI0030CBF3E9